MKLRTVQFVIISSILIGLAGCGKGGGSSSSAPAAVASTSSFPLSYQALVANGATSTFIISGASTACIGTTGSLTTTATASATFLAAPAFSATTSLAMTLSGNGCTALTAQTATAYYNSASYVPLEVLPLGVNSFGANYGEFQTFPALPTPVTVGLTGILGTELLYTDSTKTTPKGTLNQSYVIEADTSTTAIVNIISTVHDTSNNLTLTEQDRYRIAPSGATYTYTLISSDLQYAYSSSAHLILTFAPAATSTAGPFQLQNAYSALVTSGLTNTFTVSGTCTGTGTLSAAPATTAATFEGVAGFSAFTTLDLVSLTGSCSSLPPVQNSTAYYNSSHAPLGVVGVAYHGVANANYGVNSPLPTIIPASVSVGNTGMLGTETFYTDNTKTPPATASVVLSYVVEPETSTTAIVNFISKTYNASGTLTLTEQDSYRIPTTGTITLTPVSTDFQYTSPYTTHLLLTP